MTKNIVLNEIPEGWHRAGTLATGPEVVRTILEVMVHVQAYQTSDSTFVGEIWWTRKGSVKEVRHTNFYPALSQLYLAAEEIARRNLQEV